MTEPERAWILLPFRGTLLETRLAGALQDALFQGHVEALAALLVDFPFSSEELEKDAEVRAKRLVEQIRSRSIDYLGEGPYPAHWRMDAVRGVFHYAGNSAWCFDAYRLLLDLTIVDPPPPGWTALFPEPDQGALDAGGTLWDFFGDLSNESYAIDAFMAKLFDSLPVWLSPAESTFTGFLNEKDVVKLLGLLEALGEGRRERSSHLREFHGYLKRAQAANLGLTAAAVPVGTRWQDEEPLRIARHW